jgi:hypothetical protein
MANTFSLFAALTRRAAWHDTWTSLVKEEVPSRIIDQQTLWSARKRGILDRHTHEDLRQFVRMGIGRRLQRSPGLGFNLFDANPADLPEESASKWFKIVVRGLCSDYWQSNKIIPLAGTGRENLDPPDSQRIPFFRKVEFRDLFWDIFDRLPHKPRKALAAWLEAYQVQEDSKVATAKEIAASVSMSRSDFYRNLDLATAHVREGLQHHGSDLSNLDGPHLLAAIVALLF